MKCKFCSRETRNEHEVCDECEKTLTIAINKNRKKMVKTKIASQNRGITSLVCSIICLTQPYGLIVSYVCGIVAIVFANASKNTAGAQLGKVGKTLGIVGLIATVIHAFIYVVLFAVAAVAIAILVTILIGLGATTLFK